MDYFKLLRSEDESGLIEYLNTHSVDEELHKQTLLYWAVHHNNLLFTQKLIQQDADVEKKDELGRTPLQIACYFGFYDIVKFLLEQGAMVDDACIERATVGWNGKSQSKIQELLRNYNQ